MGTPGTRIELCGRLLVEIDGEGLHGALPGRQGRLLFAYLVLNRDRPVRRDELVDALWSGNGQPESADALLRPPLSRLRKALGPGRVEGRTELTLVLPPDAWIDWEVAHAALMEVLRAGGNVAEALRVYEDLRTMLRDELGTPPSARVMALHERLLRVDPEPAAEPPARRHSGPRIVERDNEVTLLGMLL